MIAIIVQYLVCIRVLHNLVNHNQGPTYTELLQLLVNVENTQILLVLDDPRQVCIIWEQLWAELMKVGSWEGDKNTQEAMALTSVGQKLESWDTQLECKTMKPEEDIWARFQRH